MALFEGAKHSGLYAKYRWAPPASVVSAVLSFVKEKLPPSSLALGIDVGCGSGQSSPRLAPYFTRVLGCDVSQAQIEGATRRNTCPNVEYRVASSSSLPALAGSCQLVTAFQACHWFDMAAFYAECDRVLCPGGVVALVSYRIPRSVNPGRAEEVSKVLRELFLSPDTGMRWGFDRSVLEDCLTAPQFTMPYQDTRRETCHKYPMETNVREFMGYVTTWSAYQEYVRECGEEEGEKLLLQCQLRLLTALGCQDQDPSQVALSLEFPYFMVLGRKPLL